MLIEINQDFKYSLSVDKIINIPSTINDLCTVFELKGKVVNKLPIKIPEILEELLPRCKLIVPQINSIFHAVNEGDTFHVWFVLSNEWEKKSLRKQIAKDIGRSNEFADQFIFYLPEKDVNETIEVYSLLVLSDQDINPLDIINPKNPTPEAEKFWSHLLDPNFTFQEIEAISIIQQSIQKLNAEKVYQAINESQEETIGVFEDSGLKIFDQRIIVPRIESPFNNAIIDIQVNEKNPEDKFKENLVYYKEIIRNLFLDIDLICILTKECLLVGNKNGKIYGTKFIENDDGTWNLSGSLSWEYNDKDLVIEILKSLISVIDRRPVFNSNTFASQYGKWSPISIWAENILFKYSQENFDKIKILFDEWEKRFSEVYQENDITIELFIKHSYLAFLVKLVLLEQFSEKIKSDNPTFIDLIEYLNTRNISLFAHDFFHWVDDVSEINKRFFKTIHGADFDSTDIFRLIYQQLVSPETRLALGEFYTPPELANLMVEETYKLGQTVLDPACGSVTFLVEIIKAIRNKTSSKNEKIESIEKIYGFDVNPISVAVSKANLLLIINKITEDPISINIFLNNTLFPLELSKIKSVFYGSVFKYEMRTIKDELVIPAEFINLENFNRFIELLRKLDFNLIRKFDSETSFIEELVKEFEKSSYSWLNNEIGYFENKITLKEAFISEIAKKIYKLHKNNKDHIWAYLLYNAIGITIVYQKIDLIIGNPPWIVIKGLYSKDYKDKLKSLAERFKITPSAKNLQSLEVAALFLFSNREVYLKKGGKIAFVLSKSFMTSASHDLTRQFKGFGSVSFFEFNKDLFRISSICIFATKLEDKAILDKYEFPVTIIEVKEDNAKRTLTKSKTTIYKPYAIDQIGTNYFVKKLIPISDEKKLLKRGENPYHSLFHQGGMFVPRRYLFVNILSEENNIAVISPLMKVDAKGVWVTPPYKETKVESEYVFDVIKSTELVPFLVLENYKVFLPIDKNLVFDEIKLKPLAKKHYKLLNDVFKTKIKEDVEINTIWKRINYQNKLTNPDQLKLPKIVYPMTGSTVKAAIIRSNYLIDTKLYFTAIEKEEEAFYLLGILNAPCITEDLTYRGSTGAGGSIRGVHKMPLELKIPKFNEKNTLHKKILDQAKEMEKKCIIIANKWRENEFEKETKKKKRNPKIKNLNDIEWKPKTIQNLIFKKLENEFNELNKLVLDLF